MSEPRVQITLNVSREVAERIKAEALRLDVPVDAVFIKAFNLLFNETERSREKGIPLAPRDAKRTNPL